MDIDAEDEEGAQMEFLQVEHVPKFGMPLSTESVDDKQSYRQFFNP